MIPRTYYDDGATIAHGEALDGPRTARMLAGEIFTRLNADGMPSHRIFVDRDGMYRTCPLNRAPSTVCPPPPIDQDDEDAPSKAAAPIPPGVELLPSGEESVVKSICPECGRIIATPASQFNPHAAYACAECAPLLKARFEHIAEEQRRVNRALAVWPGRRRFRHE